jgi:hypothetical protein
MPVALAGKTMDKSSNVRLFRLMAQPETKLKLTSPTSLLIDAILTIGFFLFIYTVVAPHVPSNDKSMILLWGGLCAACMTGVFWLCVQMFRVVLKAQIADRRKKRFRYGKRSPIFERAPRRAFLFLGR